MLQFCGNCKIWLLIDCLEKTEEKITMLANVMNITEIVQKKIRVCMLLGDTFKKSETFVWILNHV